MTDIGKYLDHFERYLHLEMSEEEVQSFDISIREDAAMRMAWQEYKAIMEAISDKELISLRMKLNATFDHYYGETVVRQLWSNKWFKISAAAVVIIIIACLVNNPERPREKDLSINITDTSILDTTFVHHDTAEVILPETPPEPEVQKEVQIASLYDDERYQISPVYAELLHTVYRSSWFRLSTPADSVMFTPSDSLVFTWETNIAESLYFDILDRNGKVVYKHTTNINSPWTYKPQLPPAIYMFRFATENEPVWMGAMIAFE